MFSPRLVDWHVSDEGLHSGEQLDKAHTVDTHMASATHVCVVKERDGFVEIRHWC